MKVKMFHVYQHETTTGQQWHRVTTNDNDGDGGTHLGWFDTEAEAEAYVDECDADSERVHAELEAAGW